MLKKQNLFKRLANKIASLEKQVSHDLIVSKFQNIDDAKLLAGMVIAVFAILMLHFLAYRIPPDASYYAFGYKTFRAFAVDFVDVVSQLGFCLIILLTSTFSNMQGFRIFMYGVIGYYLEMLYQVFFDASHPIHNWLGEAIFGFACLVILMKLIYEKYYT